MSGTNTFTVTTQAELNAAIETLDAGVSPGSYTINITSDITEGQAGQPAGIYAIDVASGVTVTIDGGGFALNGAGKDGGLAVIRGKVTIQDLTIEDAIAKGGAGSEDSGGGAGLGGGLFVGPTASVALSNVSFRTDTAKGGTGGPGGTQGGGAGGDSSLIVPALGPAGANGSDGDPGEFGPVGGDGGPGGSGQTGGAGGFGHPGGDGGEGGEGGHGGRGKTGSTNGGNAGTGGRGGDGGAGAGGGVGGIGAAGGGGGDGGAGGEGGTGGLALAFPGVGGNGGSGGAGGNGGHGATGGFGGGGGAGGAGGDGGNGNNANTSGVGSNFNGDGGPGGRGAAGGAGGFGGGGGGGGKGGAAGLGDTLKGSVRLVPGRSSTGGTGGTGGPGGFGGGGGGGGPGGSNGAKALSSSAHTVVGATGQGGQGQLGNFGGGAGGAGNSHGAGGAGGGGLGAGGDIFVAQGGTLTVDGGLLSSGTVTGGTGAQDGGAYGSGIFIQGNETITLGAPVGTTLDVSGVIADQTGSGGKGVTAGTGAVVINGSGTVKLDAENTFVGGIVVESGTLDLAQAGAAGGGPIRFDPGVLEFSPSTAPSNPIENFVAGDSIEITTFAFTHESYTGGVLTLDGAGGPVTLNVPGADPADLQFSVVDGTTIIGTDQTPCFCRGTLICTDRGEVPVETLAVGDRIVTLSGEESPIVWIGTGRVLVARGRRCAATPIIVRQGALANDVPHRDLRITKGHSLFLDGVLIPAEFLVNHRSIVWDDHAQVVEFYHIELATHDVLLADGAPAESYRDDGNRWLFQNANSGRHQPPKLPCAPVVTGGPIVDAVWRRVLQRTGPQPGVPLTDEPDLHLLVDGNRVDALTRCGGHYTFQLPHSPREVRLVSCAGSPAELGFARDPRVLGVAVRQVRLWRGPQLRVIEASDPALAEGFHEFEAAEDLRWTEGSALLPVAFFAGLDGTWELELLTLGAMRYPLLAVAAGCIAA